MYLGLASVLNNQSTDNNVDTRLEVFNQVMLKTAKQLGDVPIKVASKDPMYLIFSDSYNNMNEYAKKALSAAMYYKKTRTYDFEFSSDGISGLRDVKNNGGSILHKHIIFWALMIIAVDEEVYKTKMRMIADIAYMFEFTDEMIKDWCGAVKAVLEAKNYWEEKYFTEEAKSFFARH